MSEKIKSNNETMVCSKCGAKDIYRYDMCSKCFTESEYEGIEDEVDGKNKSAKEIMPMHSAGLRGSGDRAGKNIDKIIKRKQAIVVKMKKK